MDPTDPFLCLDHLGLPTGDELVKIRQHGDQAAKAHVDAERDRDEPEPREGQNNQEERDGIRRHPANMPRPRLGGKLSVRAEVPHVAAGRIGDPR